MEAAAALELVASNCVAYHAIDGCYCATDTVPFGAFFHEWEKPEAFACCS